MADGALLNGVARAAVDEARIHETGRALLSGYYRAPRCDGARVHQEVEFHGFGGVGGCRLDHGARNQRYRIASFDENRVGARRAAGISLVTV